jgi:hypothetical protein
MGSQIGLTGLWLFPVAFFSQIGKFYKILKISKTAFLEWVAFTLTRAWQGEVLGRIDLFSLQKKNRRSYDGSYRHFFLYVIASPQAECQARVNVNATHDTKTRVADVTLHLTLSSRSIYPAGITIGILQTHQKPSAREGLLYQLNRYIGRHAWSKRLPILNFILYRWETHKYLF